MYAIEFETDIKDKYIELHDYEKFMNKHVKVIIMAEDTQASSVAAKDVETLKRLFLKRKDMPKIDLSIDLIKMCDEVNNDNLF